MSELQKPNELEPFPHYDVLMLGAGHGTGEVIAQKLALEGYKVHVGTRTWDSFNAARHGIMEAGGIEPSGFVADLTRPEEIAAALQRSDLKPGQPIHYFDFAAAGFQTLLRPFVRYLANLERAYTSGELTSALVKQATQDIKAITITEKALQLANRVNRDAPDALGQMLFRNGNLGSGSIVATLSSCISDYTDPAHPNEYPGPWIYWPIGSSKKEGVEKMQELARRAHARNIDFIAPEIEGTDMINLFQRILPMLQSLQPHINLHIPAVSKEQVASVLYSELTRKDVTSSPRKVYISQRGASTIMPPDWSIPVIPYL